jgi:hypothetical protein
MKVKWYFGGAWPYIFRAEELAKNETRVKADGIAFH